MPTLAELEYRRLRRRVMVTRIILIITGIAVGSGLFIIWRF